MDVAFDADADADAEPAPVSAAHMASLESWADHLFSRQSFSLLSSIVPVAGLLGRRCEDVKLAVGLGVTSYYTKPGSDDVFTSILKPGSVASRSSDTEFECYPLAISSARPTWYDVLCNVFAVSVFLPF
jgi:hypothetical protein